MPCENYREALIEAAAGGGVLTGEARAHVKACASCQTAFSQEQKLFAAIDTGLRTTANSVAPASLVPRVRAQLRDQPVPRRFWVPAFAGIGIAAALVVALVLARKPARNGVEANLQAISAARNVLPAVNQPATPAGAPFEALRTARKHTRVGAVKTAPAVAAVGVEEEVLIPAGEKHAVDVLLVRLQQGDLPADALPVEGREKPSKILEVSPVDISPIEIHPLPDVESKSAAPDEKTRR
ncbi:MAG: hypothetical protein WBG02_16700 [Candidatus Acidiferrum sp.]